ncbi:hypothetical protein HJC06_14000 [Rhizobium sp. NLR9b]|nr:hypothetical protein [Rhizobium sp. NLR9b]MBX5288571.1 hypothetical protein [Rhizobium sp. NLR10b]
MTRPAYRTLVDASDSIRTTAARLDEEMKAILAEKASATGQTLSSRPMKAANAGDWRVDPVGTA